MLSNGISNIKPPTQSNRANHKEALPSIKQPIVFQGMRFLVFLEKSIPPAKNQSVYIFLEKQSCCSLNVSFVGFTSVKSGLSCGEHEAWTVDS